MVVKALVAGGTGVISTASCNNFSFAAFKCRSSIAGYVRARWGDRVRLIRGDRAEAFGFVQAFEREQFDVVYDMICYTAEDAETSSRAFATLQLGGCVAPGYGWPVAGCVGAEIGDLIGRGVNTDANVTQNTTWAAFTAGLVYRGKLRGDFGLELRLFAAVPLVRRDFDVQNSGPIFTPGTVALRGLVGASWR
jgi:hypothetical protein